MVESLESIDFLSLLDSFQNEKFELESFSSARIEALTKPTLRIYRWRHIGDS